MVNVKFENVDCIVGLKNLNDVDLVITSIPYNAKKDYGTNFDDYLTLEQFEHFNTEWLSAAKKSMKNDGRIAVNIPNAIMFKGEERARLLEPLYIKWMEKVGFKIFDEIIWVKSRTVENEKELRASGNSAWGSWCSPSSPYLRSIHEKILIAHRGEPKKFGLKENIDITPEEFVQFTHDVWSIPGRRHPTHPAVFPPAIPYRIMKLYSYKNDLCVDPFSGIGTSGIVAYQIGRNFIGFDVSQKYIDEANRELKKLKEQTTLNKFL